MRSNGDYRNSIYKDIANKYYKELFNYCYIRLGYHKENAEECTQEVFITLLLKWNNLSSLENIRAWLYRTADNVIKNHNRKSNRHKNKLSTVDVGENINLSYSEDYGTFELLSMLTIEEQELLKEYYIDKFTAKELSIKYDISENAIFIKIHRIKIKLKKVLQIENNL